MDPVTGSYLVDASVTSFSSSDIVQCTVDFF